MTLLAIRNLRAYLPSTRGPARAVDGVNLDLEEGEAMGIVGESGSGKTALALSIMGLLPGGQAPIQPGSSVRLRGEELVGIEKEQLRRVRGREIAMIFQEPMTSLNPVITVGEQIAETLRLHTGSGRRDARGEAEGLLAEVGIPEPAIHMRAYPHQLSGGMRQRVMVAVALAGEPSLLIADEPTTALDVTIQDQILELLQRIRKRRNMGLLLISHDPGVVARLCGRVAVFYGGKIVETGVTETILDDPRHPYTRGLLGARLFLHDRRHSLRPIPGEVPEASRWPPGCRFHPRCGLAVSRCRRDEPPILPLAGACEADRRRTACWVVNGGDGEVG